MLKQGLLLAIGLLSHAMFNIVDLLLIAELDDPAALAGVHVATNINFLPMIMGNAHRTRHAKGNVSNVCLSYTCIGFENIQQCVGGVFDIRKYESYIIVV